jgi:hypothetical protein
MHLEQHGGLFIHTILRGCRFIWRQRGISPFFVLPENERRYCPWATTREYITASSGGASLTAPVKFVCFTPEKRSRVRLRFAALWRSAG